MGKICLKISKTWQLQHSKLTCYFQIQMGCGKGIWDVEKVPEMGMIHFYSRADEE